VFGKAIEYRIVVSKALGALAVAQRHILDSSSLRSIRLG